MEYQKTITLLDNTPNQPRDAYNVNSQTELKTSMLRLSLCDYSDTYILIKGTISIERVQAPAEPDNDGKVK